MLFPLTWQLERANLATMRKREIVQLLGITRQHLEMTLAGKRNFSFPVSKKATAVIGGTIGLWQDRERADERRATWKKFIASLQGRVEK